MAGARPSSYKKGGGFLNEVDGLIVGYLFTTEPPFETSRKKKNSDFNPLYCILTARVDGAEEDVTTTLFVGSADDYSIEDDGLTLAPVDDSVGIRANSDMGIFIASLVEAGFPEDLLPEDAINFEAMVGTRVRFAQRTNAEKTKRLGKRKGKDGKKEYDRQDLVVDKFYALPGGAGDSKPKAGAKAKPAAKAAAKPAAKGKVAASSSADDDTATLAKDTLLEILGDNDGTVAKAKLSVLFIKKLKTHPNRQEIYKTAYSDDFLGQDDMGWSYDADSQVITLA